MSATKCHAETIAEKHAFYRLLRADERFAYRNAVLDAANALMQEGEFGSVVGVLHSFYDELKAVDAWDPV